MHMYSTVLQQPNVAQALQLATDPVIASNCS